MDFDHQQKSVAEQGQELTARLLRWYDTHARVLAWRVPKPDPYKVWLSEIMLQQTTVAAVTDYYLKFITTWPTVQALASAPLGDVLKAWAGLGYYARARNLHACAKAVVALGGLFPRNVSALMEFPGIGPYTAAAVASIAYDIPVAAVDGNVERVISRFYAITQPLPDSKPHLRDLAAALVPEKRAGDFAQAMMDLGATICTPRSPDCSACPWAHDCLARKQGFQASLPNKAARKAMPTRYGHVYWIENDKGEVLVRQRPMHGLLAGMTEFPSSPWGRKMRFAPPFAADWTVVHGLVEHTFTHFHLELRLRKTIVHEPVLGGRFVLSEQLGDEALPSVMRKVLALALKP